MKKQFHILFIILTFGFILLPTLGYACETNSQRNCCEKEIITHSTEKKECCKDSHSKEKQHDCNGKCANPNCINQSNISYAAVISSGELNHNNFNFSSKKQQFFYLEKSIPLGFIFIWLPPKILDFFI